MKSLFWILLVSGMALSACSSQKMASGYENDDVYGTSSSGVKSTNPAAASSGAASVVESTPTSKSTKPGSATLEEDYNDYSYSNRIKRFNSSDTTKSYFDDSYAEPSESQVVNENPDVNVYVGAGTGYYGAGFSIGWGSYYPYWGWDPWWGYPYYSYPYYGYPYYGWYDPWYYPCGCCYGYGWYDPYPYPYYADTYYGRRQSLYGTSGGTTPPNTRNSSRPSVNESPNTRSTSGVTTGTRQETIASSRQSTTPSSREQYRYTRPSTQRQSGISGNPTQGRQPASARTVTDQSTPRYVKPNAERTGQGAGNNVTRSYSSPAYRQPKTSQEYLSPRTQNPRVTSESQRTSGAGQDVRTGTGNTRSVTPSTGTQRSFSTPSRTETKTYSPPTRSQDSYSSPSRSGGNSGSYSSPSRSGGNSGSYSAPSRSGGGGGTSSPSGGSSGGGRRR